MRSHSHECTICRQDISCDGYRVDNFDGIPPVLCSAEVDRDCEPFVCEDCRETACESGESERCVPYGATLTRSYESRGKTISMRVCGPCALRFDEVTCEHDEPKAECSTCGEAADAAFQQRFYGGEHVSLAEHAAEGWAQKRGER